MTVLTPEQAAWILAGIPPPDNYDLCGQPLESDRVPTKYGPFVVDLHARCRDAYMSVKLDRRRRRRT